MFWVENIAWSIEYCANDRPYQITCVSFKTINVKRMIIGNR
jgi:hypothetical protein